MVLGSGAFGIDPTLSLLSWFVCVTVSSMKWELLRAKVGVFHLYVPGWSGQTLNNLSG